MIDLVTSDIVCRRPDLVLINSDSQSMNLQRVGVRWHFCRQVIPQLSASDPFNMMEGASL